MEVDQRIELYSPTPIKLKIDPTRYVVVPTPINFQYTKLFSYFKSDPIATLKVAYALIRENKKEEAQKFIFDTFLNGDMSSLPNELKQIFYLLVSSLQINPKLNDQNIKFADKYIDLAEKIGETDQSICLTGFLNYFMGNKSDSYFQRSIKMNKRYAPAYIGLAMIEMDKKNYDGAFQYLKTALTYQPANVVIRCGLARIFYLQRDIKKAIRCYETCLVIDKNCIEAMMNLSRIYWDIKSPESVKRALELAKQVIQLDKTNSSAYLVLSQASFYCGNYDASEKYCQYVIQYGNTNEQLYGHYTLGKIYHSRQNIEQALVEYMKVYENDKNHLILGKYYRIAQIRFMKKEYIQAEKILESFIQQFGEEEFDILKLIGFIKLKMSSYPSKEYNPMKKQEEAIHYLQKASKIKRDEKVELVLSHLLEEKQPKTSLSHYKNTQYENNIEIMNNIGCCHYFIQEYNESLEMFEKGLNESLKEQKEGSKITLLFNKGRVLEELNRFEEAKQCYEKILSEHPYYYDAHLRLCYHYWKEGDYNSASNELVEIYKIDPNNAECKIEMSKLLIEVGRYDEARNILESVTKLDKTNLFAFIAMATLNSKYGNERGKLNYQKSAIELYGKVLEIDPYNLLALSGLAITVGQRKESKEEPNANPIPYQLILECLTRARKTIQTKEIEISIANCYYNMKNYGQAKNEYELIIDTYGDDVEIFNALGQCCFMMDEYKDSLKYIKKTMQTIEKSDHFDQKKFEYYQYNYLLVGDEYFKEQKSEYKLYKHEHLELVDEMIKICEAPSKWNYKSNIYESWKQQIEEKIKEKEELDIQRKEEDRKRKEERKEAERLQKEQEEKEKKEKEERTRKMIEENKLRLKEEELRMKEMEIKDKKDKKEKREIRRKYVDEDDNSNNDDDDEIVMKRTRRRNRNKRESVDKMSEDDYDEEEVDDNYDEDDEEVENDDNNEVEEENEMKESPKKTRSTSRTLPDESKDENKMEDDDEEIHETKIEEDDDDDIVPLK